MSSTIGIISDVHAHPVVLQQALDLFERNGVDEILCAGDLAGYFDGLAAVIELLQRHHCKTVIGNHDEGFLAQASGRENPEIMQYLSRLPRHLSLDREGVKICMVHAQPPDGVHGGIKLLDQDGGVITAQREYWRRQLQAMDYDVLIVGHTHQVFVQQLDELLLINPGSTVFNHSCMLLSLPDKRVKVLALGGQQILKSWNFSLLRKHSDSYPTQKSH